MPSHHIPTEKLHDIIAEECINLEYFDLVSAHGFYIYLEECIVIGISNAIVNDGKLFRTVLAEEVGHHFTIISNKQPVEYLTYSDRLALDKSESAALRWAADFLIPTSDLIKFISERKLINLKDIEDHFKVMDYLLLIKFRMVGAKKPFYTLSDGRSLILTNLPDIHIFEPF